MLLPPALLLATYTTFGPIAQDDTALYVADQGAVVRVDKNDPTKRVTLTTATPHRIAAIDVDGGRVLYGTAPAPTCKPVPTFPGNTPFTHYLCALTDEDVEHEIRSVSVAGGDDQTFFRVPQGVTEIAHDDEWFYWLSPSSGIAPGSATIQRENKIATVNQTVATGLVVSAVNQHPFALAGDSVYVVNNDRLMRVAKSGGPLADVAEVNPDSSIASLDDVVYFVRGIHVYGVDARTNLIAEIHFEPPQVAGAPYPIAMLGAAPGVLLTSFGWAYTHNVVRAWGVSDLCANTTTILGLVTGFYFTNYFIPPLTEPPIAVDSSSIYIGDKREKTFAKPPAGCFRRPAVAR